MCGIFGAVGSKTAVKDVYEGLKSLEYRGYDSWGIGIEIGGKIILEKEIGKMKDHLPNLSQSDFAFGHTRWATHGGVTATNAHPHTGCSKKIAAVHNGIIENYQVLKEALKNHKFASETDTEVFVHLVEEYRKKENLKTTVRKAFLKLKGLSAFLVAEADSKTLFAIKNGSPLVIGLGENSNFVASDTNSLLPHTKKVIYLEDNQLAEIKDSSVKIFDVEDGREIEPKIEKVDWQEQKSQKENFPHFMLKEINEEPKVLENILHNFDENIENLASLLKNSQKIYLAGCGTAYFASLSGYFLFSKIAKLETIPVAGSELEYKYDFLDQNSLVLFLSQSGETIDLIEPLKKIKKEGIKTAALVNVFGSSMYRLVDEKLWLQAGPEICVLSTKAMLAKIAVLGLTAYVLQNKLEQGKEYLFEAINFLRQVLEKDFFKKYIKPLVSKLKSKEHVYIIGRGLSYPAALESALKLKEASYTHVEAFSGGELKHGAIALIEEGTPVMVFAPNDETYSSTISNAMEIKARGGFMIGISEEKDGVFDLHIPIKTTKEFTLLNQIAFAQLLAYYIAVEKGLDPDKPRNLAKSVTVK